VRPPAGAVRVMTSPFWIKFFMAQTPFDDAM
jgi:hypothetical protein